MMFLDKLALTLAIIGGLNWGAIGLFNFDLVAFICGGSGTWIARPSMWWWLWPPCGA